MGLDRTAVTGISESMEYGSAKSGFEKICNRSGRQACASSQAMEPNLCFANSLIAVASGCFPLEIAYRKRSVQVSVLDRYFVVRLMHENLLR